MTWGQLRFQLLQSTPGLPLNLLDEWLNSRYEQVLEASDWTGVHARATIQTQAAYQSTTDTVTLTIGSAAVVGVGTTWTAAIVGSKFYRPGDTNFYTVVGWIDANDLTIDRPYEGNGVDATATVYPASAYVFMQNVYALPADCRAVESILDAATAYPLNGFTPAELDASAGPRTMVEDPDSYAVVEDTPESASNPLGSTSHQVELYPPPQRARGYTVEYLRAAYAFDGTNLSASPLPFISQSVLLFGVRAEIALWQNKLTQAQTYELKFQEELKRLLMIEHSQRRSKPVFQMADRFTRHRMGRASRGFSDGWRGGEPGGPD